MKIAYIVPGLDLTGPVFIVNSLVDVLTKMGHEITVFYFFDREVEMSFKCPVYKISEHQRFDFESFDIIHSHCFRADKYMKHWRKSIRKSKWVSTIHQDTIESFRFDYIRPIAYLLGRYWLSLQNRADVVVAISNQIKNRYQQYISTPIRTIYNGVNVSTTVERDADMMHIAQSISDLKKYNKFIVGTYANIVKRKGIDQVFRCMTINRNFDFIIIGDGEYKMDLVKMAKELGINDRVHFYPFISAPYLCLSDVDVYVMPSYSEGFGLALLEAASVGKPIVCSDIPSFHELFDNDDAMFFEIGNINSLSNAINSAFNNKDTLSLKSIACAKKYTKEVMGKNYLELYHSLLKN